MKENNWARLLAYITRMVNQRLLLLCEYLAAENRILRAQLPKHLRLSDLNELPLHKLARGSGASFLPKLPALPSPTQFWPGTAADHAEV